jgi:hypothetical protein
VGSPSGFGCLVVDLSLVVLVGFEVRSVTTDFCRIVLYLLKKEERQAGDLILRNYS